jgi:type VI secretion system protein VasI
VLRDLKSGHAFLPEAGRPARPSLPLMPAASLAAIAFLLLATPAAAQDRDLDAALKACAAQDATAARRQCLDDLLVRFGYRTAPPPDAVAAPTPTLGARRPSGSVKAWLYRTETSRVDDSTSVILLLPARDLARDRVGRTYRFELSIRCAEGAMAVAFDFDGLVVSAQAAAAVNWRVDNRAPGTIAMQRSSDNRSLGLSGAAAISFVETLFGGQTLVIQANPLSGSQMVSEFPIAGIEEAIVPLREACGW